MTRADIKNIQGQYCLNGLTPFILHFENNVYVGSMTKINVSKHMQLGAKCKLVKPQRNIDKFRVLTPILN